MGRIGLVQARGEHLGEARAFAAALIDPDIASEEALRALHARTGYGIYLLWDAGRIAGVVAMVMLNRAGLEAVRDDSFDPLTPGLAHVANAGEEPAGVYGWGVAGATREAAHVVVQGSRVALETVRQPYFARAATAAGRRMLIEKLGFDPYPGNATGLLWRDPDNWTRRAA